MPLPVIPLLSSLLLARAVFFPWVNLRPMEEAMTVQEQQKLEDIADRLRILLNAPEFEGTANLHGLLAGILDDLDSLIA